MGMNIIEQAIIALLLRPRDGGIFYASLLSQMRRIEDKDIGTAGVTVQGGRLMLFYNPEFLQTLSPEELTTVLEHECLHLVMNHIKRIGTRDMPIWNFATDLAINQLLEHLPKDCITLNSFPKEWRLPPKAIAEIYYDIIDKHTPRISFKQNADGSTTAEISDKDGKKLGEMVVDKTGTHKKWGSGDSDGSGNPEQKQKAEGKDNVDITEEVIKQAVREAQETSERQQGSIPDEVSSYIKELLKPAIIPWQQLLRRYIASSIKSGQRSSWKRPNRRFGSTQKGYLPDRIVAITLAIDTSGSISDKDFVMFMSEIQAIQKCYKSDITVLECDAKIQKEYKLTTHGKLDTKFKGRGGTDFCPVFDYIKQKNIKTDILIYFTDLCGSFPRQEPNYNTLWAVCDSYYSKDKTPFGKILDLHPEAK